MGYLKAIIAGVIAGLIGAAIWAAIAYYSGYEIGWIAWIIGGLVGIAVAVASSENKGLNTGIIAVVIAAASICVGKYAAVHFTVSDITSKVVGTITVDEEDAKMEIATALVKEYESGGKVLKWADGMTIDTTEKLADFPKDLVKDVESRWSAMSATAQTNYRDALKETRKAAFASISGHIESEGFFASFGLLDLLFFGLAMFTAFKVGSGMQSDEED